MIHRVYGKFTPKLLSQIMVGNPDIQSPEHVRAGMDLSFPVSESAKPFPRTGIYHVFMETGEFARAFSKAMSGEYTKNVPVRILPRPLPDDRFLFYVILDCPFGTRARGLTFMEKNYPEVTPNFLDMVSLGPEQSATKGSAL